MFGVSYLSLLVGGGGVVSSLSRIMMEVELGEPTPTMTSEVGFRRFTVNTSFPSTSLSSTVLIVTQLLVDKGWNKKPSPEISP